MRRGDGSGSSTVCDQARGARRAMMRQADATAIGSGNRRGDEDAGDPAVGQDLGLANLRATDARSPPPRPGDARCRRSCASWRAASARRHTTVASACHRLRYCGRAGRDVEHQHRRVEARHRDPCWPIRWVWSASDRSIRKTASARCALRNLPAGSDGPAHPCGKRSADRVERVDVGRAPACAASPNAAARHVHTERSPRPPRTESPATASWHIGASRSTATGPAFIGLIQMSSPAQRRGYSKGKEIGSRFAPDPPAPPRPASRAPTARGISYSISSNRMRAIGGEDGVRGAAAAALDPASFIMHALQRTAPAGGSPHRQIQQAAERGLSPCRSRRVADRRRSHQVERLQDHAVGMRERTRIRHVRS